MAETGYKILKLKSGETLVAQIRENTKSHVGVFRPMEIKYMHMIDINGRKHETMVLVDWLKSTIENTFKLDKNFILGIFSPRPDIISHYENQMVIEDVGGIAQFPMSPPPSNQNQQQALQNILADALLKDLLDSKSNGDDEDDMNDANDLIQDLIIGNRQERMINEKDDPNYGSSYCDWSSDVEDYLS